MNNEQQDLYDRFFSELEDALLKGEYKFAGQIGFSQHDALQAVLQVIKKYNAIPQEPKEEENGVPTT